MLKTTARFFHSALYVGLLASLAACKNAEDQQPVDTAPTESEQTTGQEQMTVAPPMNLNGQVEFSKKDLAQRLDVPPESVVLSGANPVTWRNGALGCPEPGMNYTEALVPGSVIYLQVDNVIHAYHAKYGSEPFYCPRERVEAPVRGEGEDLT